MSIIFRDRDPLDKNKSFQGFLNLKRVKRGLGATFCCIPGSHLHQKEFSKRFEKRDGKQRFFRIENQEQIDYLLRQKTLSYYALELKVGDFLLWDSRVIHQGRVPVYDAKNMEPLERCGVYVSMQPKEFSTTKDLEKKREAWNALTSTTHNASNGVQRFPKNPRIYSKEEKRALDAGEFAMPVTEHPVLTRQMRAMFGLP